MATASLLLKVAKTTDHPATIAPLTADDLGWGDLAVNGNPHAASPNLDCTARNRTTRAPKPSTPKESSALANGNSSSLTSSPTTRHSSKTSMPTSARPATSPTKPPTSSANCAKNSSLSSSKPTHRCHPRMTSIPAASISIHKCKECRLQHHTPLFFKNSRLNCCCGVFLGSRKETMATQARFASATAQPLTAACETYRPASTRGCAKILTRGATLGFPAFLETMRFLQMHC